MILSIIQTYPDEETAAIGHAVDRMIDNHTFKFDSLLFSVLDYNMFSVILMGKSTVFGKCVGVMAADKVPSFLLPIAEFLGGKFGGSMVRSVIKLQ